MNTFDVTIKHNNTEHSYMVICTTAQIAIDRAMDAHQILISGDPRTEDVVSVVMRPIASPTPAQSPTSTSTLSDGDIVSKARQLGNRFDSSWDEDRVDLVRWAEAAMQAAQSPARGYVPLSDSEIEAKAWELGGRDTGMIQDRIDFARWIEQRFTQGCATSTPQSTATPDVDNVPGWDWAREHGFATVEAWAKYALVAIELYFVLPGDPNEVAQRIGIPSRVLRALVRPGNNKPECLAYWRRLAGVVNDESEDDDLPF